MRRPGAGDADRRGVLMDLQHILGYFAIALFAGIFGSMFGLGGGIIMVPGLTLLYGVPIQLAAGTSLFCVVATSLAATAVYLKQQLTDLRLGLWLELPTLLGVIAGGLIAFALPAYLLQLLFAVLICYVGIVMWRDSRRPAASIESCVAPQGLSGEYFDPDCGERRTYHIQRLPLGMATSIVGGLISSMLGVGGGFINVPVMRLYMCIPLRVATATSSFMIGITAAASVLLYYRQDAIVIPMTAVCALGILIGATLGPRLAARIKTPVLQRVFVIVLAGIAIQMAWKALQGGG